MRLISTLALAVLLAACATTPPPVTPLEGVSRPGALMGVATLSTSACEAATAPTYTAAIVATRKAEARVKAGTLGLGLAGQIATLARQARADLDAACVNGTLDANRLGAADAAVIQMNSLLGGGR